MDDPVVAQLAAYNAHDVDAFVACYAVDARSSTGTGGSCCREHAAAARVLWPPFRAASGRARRCPSERLREGAWVVDHEAVRTGAAASGYVVAYRVRDRVIYRVVILGE